MLILISLSYVIDINAQTVLADTSIVGKLLPDRFARISILFGNPRLNYFSETFENYKNSGYPSISHGQPKAWNVSVEKNINKTIRIGFMFNYFIQSHISGSNWKNIVEGIQSEHHDISQHFKNYGLKLYADYVIVVLKHLDGTRLEFAAGLGIGANRIRVNGKQSFVLINGPPGYIIAVNDTVNTFSLARNVVSSSITTSLDFYILQNVSLQLKGEYTACSVVKIPAQELVYNISTTSVPSYKTITLKKQHLGFSSVILWMGVHVHI
ncbi:hypothetical protein K1X84_09685 [bacterium]|nr:hypothetical protein [bacterium]